MPETEEVSPAKQISIATLELEKLGDELEILRAQRVKCEAMLDANPFVPSDRYESRTKLEKHVDTLDTREQRLTDAEKQLRVEKKAWMEMLHEQQQQQQHRPLDYRGRFVKLLSEHRYITVPHEEVLDVIVRRFSTRLVAISTPEDALTLYEDAKLYPGTSTTALFFKHHDLQLNGPYNQASAHIVTGVQRGKPVIIKLLHRDSPSESRAHIKPSEAVVCEDLDLPQASASGVKVVRAHLIELELGDQRKALGASGKYWTLVMPQYCSVVADLFALPLEVIAAGASGVKSAVEFLHNRGYVHMDIKAANIFVDVEGVWLLGDFGSTVKEGDEIKTYTQIFHPSSLYRKPAKTGYDWYMFAVMVAVELHKKEWKEVLCGQNSPVKDIKLKAALSDYHGASAKDPCLREILEWVLQQAEI